MTRTILLALFAASCALAGTNTVHLRIIHGGAREAPPVTEDILFALQRPAAKEWNFDLPSVMPVNSGYEGKSWYAGGWERPIYIFEYSGLIRIPETGDYTFHTQRPTMGPAYLFIGDDIAIDFPNRLPDREQAGSWIAGKSMHLEKGNVEYRAIGYCERTASFPLGWIHAGLKEMHEIGSGFFHEASRMRHWLTRKPLVYKAVDARMAGVPPFCFPQDVVRPQLHIRSNVTNVEVTADIRHVGDGRENVATTSVVRIVNTWGAFTMPPCKAGEVASISWSVSAQGSELSRGVTSFVAPPFDIAPDRADGGALFAGETTNCVFVARPSGPATFPDKLTSPARIIPLGEFDGVTPRMMRNALSMIYEEIPDVANTIAPEALVPEDVADFSYPWLTPLTRLGDTLPQGAVLFAPDLRMKEESLESFRRRLNATTGILSEALGRDVVLATPPQNDEDAADIRPYAEAIHRAADAYGLPVADFYTLGHTMPTDEDLTHFAPTETPRAAHIEGN